MSEMIALVRIWGNWCGPNWTGGQRVSAQDYQGSWSSPAIDNLDTACRTHDKACSGPEGCSKKADDDLLKVARKISGNPIERIFRKQKVKASDKIIAAITAARFTRKH